MSIKMACPGCGASYTLADELKGMKIRCKKCEEIFAVNGVAKREIEEAIEPAEKVRPGPRAAAPTVRRRGVDDDASKRTALRPAVKTGRRRGEDPEEDKAPEPAEKGAATRPAGSKKPLIIVGGAVGGLVLIGGIVVAIALLNKDDDKPTKPSGTSQQASNSGSGTQTNVGKVPDTKNENGGNNPVVPVNGQQDVPKVNNPPPRVEVGGGFALSQDAVERVKKSTVFIEVVNQVGGENSGSGFFGGEPGIILTNAHVLGMLQPGSPPPKSIKVRFNSGERNEWEANGKILGVDGSSDLAVLKIDGPQEKIPPPLKILPTSTVQVAQDIFVVGFPGGGMINRAPTFGKSSVSAFLRDGETKRIQRIQMEGGSDMGNSGGPVITVNGDVVGVNVSGHKTALNVKFSIPGDHVFEVLNGRVVTVTFREPYAAGKDMKLPVEVRLIDPLGRVQEVGIDYWKGQQGESRPPATSQPETLSGDSQHQSLVLALDKQKHMATGELTLPNKEDDQVYWQQPFCVGGKGTKQWSEGAVCNVSLPAAERRPGNLVVRHTKSRRPVDLECRASYRVLGAEDDVHERLFAMNMSLFENLIPAGKDKTGVALKFTKMEMRLSEDGRSPPRLQGLAKALQDFGSVKATLKMDQLGNVTDYRTDLSEVPQQSQSLTTIVDLAEISLGTLAVPLPNKQKVEPLEQWEGVRELNLDQGGRNQTGLLKMKYVYLGSRRRAGREEAIVEMTGQIGPPGSAPGLEVKGREQRLNPRARGSARGTAIVDVETGQVSHARIVADIDTEITIQTGGRSLTGRAAGHLELTLRRGTSVGQ